ncbi:HAD-IA family hydrolase [Psychrobacter sp. HD31]|uniref:HAD family hydrolase n=1 Tax=Psychrobacter sp. HD31 TaxID=3112003 RepID=UPI003DA4972F
MTAHTTLKAVLFDLDGTLVDTAADFVRIIHEMAAENGWQAPSNQVIREQVSAGAKAMVSLFSLHNHLGDDARQIEEKVMTYRQAFLERYEAEICVDSQIFQGLDVLLARLEEQNIPWGVVTNKSRYLAEKLLEALNLSERCQTLVCPEDVTHTKPDPEPMYLAVKALGLTKSDCTNIIYVGDHIRDIQAGNAAGMLTVAAKYGYISTTEKQQLDTWQANDIVETPEALLTLILSR